MTSLHGLSLAHQIDPLTDSRWPEFVARHPRASIFHTREWLQAVADTYGHKPAAFTTTASGPLLNGLVFCRLRSWLTGRRLVSVPFADHCEILCDNPEDYEALIGAILKAGASEGCKYIEVRPVSEWSPSEQLRGRTTRQFFLHRLDLRPGAEELFRSFHKSCVQRRIQHAENSGLSICEGRDDQALGIFYEAVLKTRRRHRLPPQPLSWFRNLLNRFADRALIRYASAAGRPVAAIFTIQHANKLFYKYGASDARFHNLGAIPFLFWHAIQDAVAQGLEELDLGRTDFEDAGLAAFKERWGALRSTISYQTWPSDASPRASHGNWIGRIAGRALAFMPDGCLAAVGRLAYRHIE